MSNGKLTESKVDLRDLSEDVKEYINLRFQIIRLNVTEKIATALASFVSAGAAVIFFLMFFFFASIGLAWWLGTVMNNIALGFLVVAGVYLLLAFIFIAISKKSVKPNLTNMFIKDFSNDDDD